MGHRSPVAQRALTRLSSPRGALLVLGLVLLAALLVWVPASRATTATAYFSSTNGIYAGDEVRVLGVPVGKITSIHAERDRVKVELKIDAG